MIERKIGFIGAGLMAESLIRGMLEAEVAVARNLFASDPSEERRELMESLLGPNVFSKNGKVLANAEVVVLSVKPQVLSIVTEEISPDISSDQLLVSIAPGVTLRWLEEKVGTARLVRVMPNTPALVKDGAAAFCRGSRANEGDGQVVEEMLSAVGLCEEVDEKYMDAVTGLSGSGPAYVYMIIEALSDGGVKMGLQRKVATRLAAQTVLGAARMVLESGTHPGELKDQVTTPGGTTIEAVHALEKAGLRKALIDAVEAASEKSRQLGRE
ncbi:MAG: pyrroline-5-carboxylate reductase [Candidatus Brocadiia bacterium]